jgi:hypothetical protein
VDQVYWLVQVFDTKPAMLEYCKANCGNPMVKKDAAVCHNFFEVKFKGKKVSHLKSRQGIIHLYRGRCSNSIVAHECGHAAISYVMSKRKTDLVFKRGDLAAVLKEHHHPKKRVRYLVSKGEEDICYALGNLLRQCVIKFYEKKVWP